MYTNDAAIYINADSLSLTRSNNYEDTWREAKSARERDIEMIAVGIGGNTRMEELMAIASEPNDLNVLTVNSFDQLPAITTSLLDAVCNSTFIAFTSR